MRGDVDWDRLDAEAFPPVGPTVEAPYFGPPEELRAGRPRRVVRQRPSPRYDSPEELVAWHMARIKVAAAWGALVPVVTVAGTTAVIFFAELIW